MMILFGQIVSVLEQIPGRMLFVVGLLFLTVLLLWLESLRRRRIILKVFKKVVSDRFEGWVWSDFPDKSDSHYEGIVAHFRQAAGFECFNVVDGGSQPMALRYDDCEGIIKQYFNVNRAMYSDSCRKIVVRALCGRNRVIIYKRINEKLFFVLISEVLDYSLLFSR